MANLGLTQVELVGTAELKAAFNELTQGMRRRVIVRAAEKAAQILVAPLRRATPKSPKGMKSSRAAAINPSGTLRKSTGRTTRKYKGGAIAAVYVGHRWHKKGKAAHLVEGGTKDRYTKAGRFAGRVVARPFFKPVYEANRSKMQAVMRDEIAAGLATERTKAAQKSLQKITGGKV